MAIQYSGGTYINTTFVGDTKANIITALQTQLTAAGWTVISGGGTTNVLMQTAQASGSLNQGRVRFKDNGNTCVQVTIENGAVSGMRTAAGVSASNAGGMLLPATAKVWRILASKFRFEVFTPIVSQAREFAMAGILYVPTPFIGVIQEAIYMNCNSAHDADTLARACARSNASWNGGQNCCGIYNGIIMDHNADANTCCGDVQVRIPCNGFQFSYTRGNNDNIIGSMNLCRWPDMSGDSGDPYLGWGTFSTIDEALIRGQMFDWTYIPIPFIGDMTSSWVDQSATHNFFNLTHYNPGAAQNPRGGFWVAYS